MNEILSGLANFSLDEDLIKVIIFVIGISIIVSLIRSLFRLALPFVLIGLVMVVFFGFSPDDVIKKGKQFASFGTSFIQENILPFINNDLQNNESPLNDEQNERKVEDIFEQPTNDSDLNKL